MRVELNEPVTTYKVLEVEDGPFDPIYHSPYNKYLKHSTWSVGKTNEITALKNTICSLDQMLVRGDGYFTPFRVEGLALHSYASFNDALRTLNWFKLNFPENKYVIGECWIPEDCDYVYCGNDGRPEGSKAYASQKLTLLNIIEDGDDRNGVGTMFAV